MLNATGGVVIIGVDEAGSIIGLANAQERTSALEQQLREGISPAAPLGVRVEPADGKNVIVVDVPQGHDGPYAADGSIYVRRGAHTRKGSSSDISRLIAPKGTARWERQPCLPATSDDLDKDRVLDAAKRAQKRWGGELATGRIDDVLRTFNLADGGTIRNSAIVLFGRKPSVFFPQVRVRAAAFSAERELSDNQILEGNLFELLEACLRFLQRNLPVRSSIRVGEVKRRDRLAIPIEVLREAVLNAIVHRDYSSYSGSVSLTIHADSLEVWNSGPLPDGMTIEDLGRGHASRPQNPDIAYVAFLTGMIERLGVGTQFILRAYDGQKQGPVWRLDSGGVRLRLPMVEEVASRFLPNKRQRKLLSALAPHHEVTVAGYAKRAAKDVSERQARADLADLVEAGLLARKGQGRATRYVRTETALAGDD
jgi:ATP-dependent DNA helicase RecG